MTQISLHLGSAWAIEYPRGHLDILLLAVYFPEDGLPALLLNPSTRRGWLHVGGTWYDGAALDTRAVSLTLPEIVDCRKVRAVLESERGETALESFAAAADTDARAAAVEHLRALLTGPQVALDGPHAGVWDAADWLPVDVLPVSGGYRVAVRAANGALLGVITAETGDERVSELVMAVDDDARTHNVVIRDSDEYLHDRRDWCVSARDQSGIRVHA